MATVKGLHPELRTIAGNVPRVARMLGFNAKVTSGYRSYAKQAKLYATFVKGLSPYPVAPPGTSLHESGLAIDIVTDNLSKLVPLLAGVGLRWAGIKDPIHFDFAIGSPRTNERPAVKAKPKVEYKTAWDRFKGEVYPTLPTADDYAETIKSVYKIW